MVTEGFSPGIQLPDDMQHLVPSAECGWDDALSKLRQVVSRTQTERMGADHPVLGPMSHEQWVQFHCRHAELHFSFVHGV